MAAHHHSNNQFNIWEHNSFVWLWGIWNPKEMGRHMKKCWIMPDNAVDLCFSCYISLTWKTCWFLFGLKYSSDSIMRIVLLLQFGDNDKQHTFIHWAAELYTHWLMLPGGTDTMQISNCKRITWIHHPICQKSLQCQHNITNTWRGSKRWGDVDILTLCLLIHCASGIS